MSEAAPMSLGELARFACIAEVLAPKAGNVHPGASFDDATWMDFVVSATVIAPHLDRAHELGVGRTVLACVRATREAVGTNTNLGLVLLLAPLCAVRPGVDPADSVRGVLSRLTREDAEAVYEAIRLAAPGGMGDVDRADVGAEPPDSLLEAMDLAAPRDRIARQYVTEFHDVIHGVAPRFEELSRRDTALDRALVRVHLELLAAQPDSLIVRKCGSEVGTEAQRLAQVALSDAGGSDDLAATPAFERLDRFLRADGHRRNPGTSADLVAAGLFVALRRGHYLPPVHWAGSLSSCAEP